MEEKLSIPTVNAKKLKDGSISMSDKFQITAYLQKEKIIKVDSLISLIPDTKSRSNVIEKAIDFFFAYTTSQMSQDYLCGVFGAKMEGLVGNLTSRISKSNFRNAVESDMTNRMLSTVFEIDRNKYDKLRAKAIQDVKRTNGSIDILEAINEMEED
ncbi:hypothetical protein [Caproiciproducens sp.]|uniref:hypothetical protein n=1 Tax=Caproiciproducens sp. TaxID=1954376 RepID=UPI0028A1AD90|nr:hypothetical protein [Caproiciproducens sp.]